ncbi:hypothetical protein AM1_0190 [Acaryochloris marina MBIC11017]|uniref:Uncharacterized protein n=1 Tax=Acaryochloris marina (strain MBIC 11017) TaxID=329726 RepID=B0C7L6_ACAM1|nr:hypothetical protein AM1_0190 [Acaryochloris marina MBIC11017]
MTGQVAQESIASSDLISASRCLVRWFPDWVQWSIFGGIHHE